MSDNNQPCFFCSVPVDRVIAENELAFAIKDGFPVTEGHTLIIPHRHVVDFFGLTEAELGACNALLYQLRAEIMANEPTVDGFNIGMNAGEVAGRTFSIATFI